MTSEFGNFVSAALNAFYAGDYLPTNSLADYLQDRGDERGVRLKKRFARWVTVNDRKLEQIKTWHACPEVRGHEGDRGLMLLEFNLSQHRAAWVSYFIRLVSVKPGERVPREKISGCYALTHPAF